MNKCGTTEELLRRGKGKRVVMYFKIRRTLGSFLFTLYNFTQEDGKTQSSVPELIPFLVADPGFLASWLPSHIICSPMLLATGELPECQMKIPLAHESRHWATLREFSL